MCLKENSGFIILRENVPEEMMGPIKRSQRDGAVNSYGAESNNAPSRNLNSVRWQSLVFTNVTGPRSQRMTNSVGCGVKNFNRSGAAGLRQSTLLQKENPN